MILSINVPDAIAPRVVNGLCTRWRYPDTITDITGSVIPNPQTKASFIKERIILYVKATIADAEIHASTTASDIRADVDAAIPLT